MNKHYYCTLDTETSKSGKAADIGIVVSDKNGNIIEKHGILLIDIFNKEDLFYDNRSDTWTLDNARARKLKYQEMLNNGLRVFGSVAYVNNTLRDIVTRFNPCLTAYNIGFDYSACLATGIDLLPFARRFDLMNCARDNICSTDTYKVWAYENNYLTSGGNPSYTVDAVAHYIDSSLPPEPHTALEDAMLYESTILAYMIALPRTRAQILAAGASKTGKAKWCAQ